MAEDIEVEIQVYRGYRTLLKSIRCTDFRIRRHPVISKCEYIDEGHLFECVIYNKDGDVLHQTELGRNNSFQTLQHKLPSGYTYKLECPLHLQDEHYLRYEYRNSIVDNEGRPHGLYFSNFGGTRWVHGHPETAHQMFIYEHNTKSEGRVFFTPLGGGLYLLDYYYIDCDQEICERFYNIYRLNPEGPVNLVFEKKHQHTFGIRLKGSHERYIDYNIPVEFINPDFQTPTEDRKFYALQKKEVDAYLEAHGFRPEDYDNSTPYYESYMVIYNQTMMAKEDKYNDIEFTYEELDFGEDEGEEEEGEEGEEEQKEDDTYNELDYIRKN